jgi:hypothetical protein
MELVSTMTEQIHAEVAQLSALLATITQAGVILVSQLSLG